MLIGMGKKLAAGAASAAGLGAEVARHLAWYLSHQVNPRPRDKDDAPGPKS